MREHWQRFAAADAAFYTLNLPAGTPASDYLGHGAAMVNDALAWLGEGSARRRMLEIGCGLGRTAVNFCSHFERVDAVDIAPAMLDAVRLLNPPSNLHLSLSSGHDLSPFQDGAFDFVYSYVVFQHIPDGRIVDAYIREVARVLAVGGRAILQYDTRPTTLSLRLYKALPDIVLPRAHRRFIRRYRRDAAALRRTMAAAGLRIADERGAGSSEHYFLVESPAGA